jgi:hypothetical protein
VLSLLPTNALAPPPRPAAADGAAVATCARAAATSSSLLFTSTFDAMDPAFPARLQPLAGLVHHSARFPVVSPAGTVKRLEGSCSPQAFRLVDGGYFDNSGVQTTLELIDTLREIKTKDGEAIAFTPILLVVRNSASEDIAKGSAGPFPETSAVLGTLLAVRGAHAVLARDTAARRIPACHIVELNVRPNSNAPLGWSLSRGVRKQLDDDAKDRAQKTAPYVDRLLALRGEEECR